MECYWNIRTRTWGCAKDNTAAIGRFEPLFLRCAYEDRSKVKELGASWDNKSMRWFVCPAKMSLEDLEVFADFV